MSKLDELKNLRKPFYAHELELRLKIDAMLAEAMRNIQALVASKLDILSTESSEHESSMDEYKQEVIVSLEKKKEEINKQMNSEMDTVCKKIATVCEQMSSATKEEMSMMEKSHKASMKEMEEKLKNSIAKTVKQIEKMRGPKGEPGYTPKKNLDYFDGKQGSPDTPDQVVNKVIKSEKTLPLSKIDGLEKELAIIKQTKRQKGGGGGMGNWVHQQFSTSSSTTSITLSSNVAANGTALLLRYQGQVLFHGSQYTVSGRVITFTFTLDNSTTVDATYVRA